MKLDKRSTRREFTPANNVARINSQIQPLKELTASALCTQGFCLQKRRRSHGQRFTARIRLSGRPTSRSALRLRKSNNSRSASWEGATLPMALKMVSVRPGY